MADKREIYDFAIKWFDKFSDKNIGFIELFDHHFADDCEGLGFKNDYGKEYLDFYDDIKNEGSDLDDIIDEVIDIEILGFAIYKKWRYLSRNDDKEKILKDEDRSWFKITLSRLAGFASCDQIIFHGELKTIRIKSNAISFGPMPVPSKEVEQKITINNRGQIWFSGYNYGDGYKYEKGRSKYLKIENKDVKRIFDAFSYYFENKNSEVFVTDIGSWDLELKNAEEKKFFFTGSLCARFKYKGIDLSDLVREVLGMDDLYVLDGKFNKDTINRITLDYNGFSTIYLEGGSEYSVKDYSEKLIIDRESESMEYIQKKDQKYKISHKYEIGEDIGKFLKSFVEEDFFSFIRGNPDDLIEIPDKKRSYTITIDFKNEYQEIISGSFDKNDLPCDFSCFIDKVTDFMKSYERKDIFNPSIYEKEKRRKNDYIFCSVEFDEGIKSYYYLTDDDSIELGDFVLVPAGEDNHNAVVKVVKIEYFNEISAPLAIEKMKKIIRKFTDEEFRLLNE